ncbi:MAG: ankyrin repeat domain-containing protein, partial [Rhabdochlamydiaceae bacterium]
MSFSSSTVQPNSYLPFIQSISSNWDADDELHTHVLIRDRKQQELQDWLACNELSSAEEKKRKIFFRVNGHDFINRGLSPLHIASMTGNFDAADALISTRVCNPNVKDHGGATPMHHAAVRADFLFIQILKKKGADDRIQDYYGGTANDILRQCHPNHNPSEQQFFYMLGNEIIEGSGHDFKRLTGADFIHDDMIQAPADWIQSWQEAYELGENQRNMLLREPYFQTLANLYHSFLTKPPQLYMDK